MSKPIVLPADVYDTLHFSALAFGGIGGGSLEDHATMPPEPRCFIGHLEAAGVPVDRPKLYGQHPIYGITADDSDNAVVEVNRTLGNVRTYGRRSYWARIPFEEWCRRLNVVRGA
jgi:hypothetical protein